MGTIFNEEDRSSLLAAAYLHDIGSAPSLGAHGLSSTRVEPLTCEPTTWAAWPRGRAYHSEAEDGAALRGPGAELAQFPRETSAVPDALTSCDITTSATGVPVSFQERIADMFRRYDETSIVAQAIRQAQLALARVIEHMHQDDQRDAARRILPP